MPNYRTHLLGGSFVFLILCFFLRTNITSLFTLCNWLLCSLLGALFPDIDTKSKGQILFYRIIVILIGLLCIQGRYLLAAGSSLVCMLPLIVRHRGIFHSYMFVTFLSLCAALILMIEWSDFEAIIMHNCLFFIVGVYSHLFLDFLPKKFFPSKRT